LNNLERAGFLHSKQVNKK